MLRLIKGVFSLLLLTAFVFVTGQTALAARGSETVTGNWLDGAVVKTAKGTKLEGPLAIYYEEVAGTSEGCPILGITTNMFLFLRLRHGSTLYPFSGIVENICFGDLDAQNAEIVDFVGTTVVPIIFPENPSYDPLNPGFALKSTDQVVESDEFGCCGAPEMLFTIMDIVIAVE